MCKWYRTHLLAHRDLFKNRQTRHTDYSQICFYSRDAHLDLNQFQEKGPKFSDSNVNTFLFLLYLPRQCQIQIKPSLLTDCRRYYRQKLICHDNSTCACEDYRLFSPFF
ncbi:unnamed protein product [Tenebrio molitor]|nr:unnamed protein product [Tenebrio molitor]